MRYLLRVPILALALACDSPTAPAAPTWHEGTWRAVSAGGRPLPYTTTAGAVDSLLIVFTTSQPLDQYSAWSYAGSTSDGTTTRVTAVGVWSAGKRIAPVAPPFSLAATVVRDTLIVSGFAGAEWRLVKR